MINTIKNPDKSQWEALCKRPVFELEALFPLSKDIFEDVKNRGDAALADYTEKFDGVRLEEFKVTQAEISKAGNELSEELKSALEVAYKGIYKFHKSQVSAPEIIETAQGVSCWRENRAIERVGFYIPGGTAPLFSTVLMLGIPAKIAGCKEIVLCTPPDKQGNINPAILYAAQLVGISSIFKVGGIQAVAAMSIGTESIPKTSKLFGPGNQYVMAAKQVSLNYGMAIDMPAGPSEVLVIADEQAIPEFVASDLLSQAEHGSDSQVVLVSDSESMLNQVKTALQEQLENLPRKEIAEKALKHCRFILFKSLKEGMEFSNVYAPEHLILAMENPEKYTAQIQNAGSVFLGKYSCESLGDYASGTNHTLPTNGFSKSYSGVSVDSFVKKITFQKVEEKGIKTIGRAVELMAEAEGLIAHKQAVSKRLNYINNKKSL